MKALRTAHGLAAAFLFTLYPAVGWAGMELTCRADVMSGNAIVAELLLENEDCSGDAQVRLISSVAGNAAQNLAGIGIVGPEVVNSAITVPAATDEGLSGCFFFTPGVFTGTIWVSPVVPSSFDGTVVTAVVATEWRIAGKLEQTLVRQCLVNVHSAP